MSLSPDKLKSPKTYSGKLFVGILLEPVMVPHFPELTNTDQVKDAELIAIRNKIRNDANEQLAARILALATHYNIRLYDDIAITYFKIIKALAADFLPGFQLNLRKPETRQRGSYTIGGPDLFDAVSYRRTSKKETILQACEYLSRHGKGKLKNAGAANLEVAYHRYKKTLQKSHEYIEKHPVYSELIDILGYDELSKQIVRKHSRVHKIRTKPKS